MRRSEYSNQQNCNQPYYTQQNCNQQNQSQRNQNCTCNLWQQDNRRNNTSLCIPACTSLSNNLTPVLSGIQVQLVGKKGGSVAYNETVIFDSTTNDRSAEISYNPFTGEFTLLRTGNYFVSWWVATDGSDVDNLLQFSVVTNAMGGAVGASPLATGQISGTALLTVQNAPATLVLKNTSINNISLATTPVQANIVILQGLI